MSVDVRWISKRLQRMIMVDKRSADGSPEGEQDSKKQFVGGFDENGPRKFACRVDQSSIKGVDGLMGLFPGDLGTFDYLKNNELPIALYPGIVREYTFKGGEWVANKVYGEKPDVCEEEGPMEGLVTAPHYAIEIRGNKSQKKKEKTSMYFILDVVNENGCLRRDWQDLYVGQQNNQFDDFLTENFPQVDKLMGRVQYNAWMANEPPVGVEPNVFVQSIDVRKPLISGTSACIAMYAYPDVMFDENTELHWCYGTEYGVRTWETSCETQNKDSSSRVQLYSSAQTPQP